MKYSDQQRVNKIYDYASKLTKYVHDNNGTSRIRILGGLPIPFHPSKMVALRMSKDFAPWPTLKRLPNRTIF